MKKPRGCLRRAPRRACPQRASRPRLVMPSCGGDWTISIISHRHGDRVLPTLVSLAEQMGRRDYRVVLTINAPENIDYLQRAPNALRRRLTVVHGSHQRSFAENHNRALLGCHSRFALALDPELTFKGQVLNALEATLALPRWGLGAPRAYTEDGMMDDNARRMVTPRRLLQRYLTHRGGIDYDTPATETTIAVDWVAGLFMAFRSEVFQAVRGFDTRYRLYCEDVDLCLRVRQAGYDIALLTGERVIHPAGRRSLRELRHFRWHSHSLLRLWTSPDYRRRDKR